MSADYTNIFESQPETIERTIDVIEGELPADLEGTLLRNGPGIFTSGSDPLNFLDGHGCVAALTIAKKKCSLVGRPVKTELLDAETAKGRALRRRLFTNLPSRTKNMLNLDLAATANHDIYAWAGRVFAAQEGGHYELDPKTLETRGPSRWLKAVPDHHTMCPMPRVDLTSNRLVAYSIQPGKANDDIVFYELDDDLSAERQASFPLAAAPTIVHDLAFTNAFTIVSEWSARLSTASALWGKRTVYDSFRWPADVAATLAFFTRDPKKRREAFRVALPKDTRAAPHIVNAWDEDDRVIVDAIAYDAPIPFNVLAPPALRDRDGLVVVKGAPPVLMRYEVDPRAGTIEAKKLCELPCELPEVNARMHGKKHAFTYAATPASEGDEPDPDAFVYFHGIAKVRDDGEPLVHRAAPNTVVSQPAFAKSKRGDRRAEDDGYVLYWETDLDAKEASVVVLDARDLKFVARARLGVWLPPPSHTSFWEL